MPGDYGRAATNLWTKHFKIFELDEIMWQKGDGTFAEMLNRLRKGKQSHEDIMKLKECQVAPNDNNRIQQIKTLPHFYSLRIKVDAHNDKIFNEQQTFKMTVKVNHAVLGDCDNEVRQRLSKSIQKLKHTVTMQDFIENWN